MTPHTVPVAAALAPLLHIDAQFQPSDNHRMFDRRGVLQSLLGNLLEFDQLAAAIIGIGAHHNSLVKL